jgi:hypothetical protein
MTKWKKNGWARVRPGVYRKKGKRGVGEIENGAERGWWWWHVYEPKLPSKPVAGREFTLADAIKAAEEHLR